MAFVATFCGYKLYHKYVLDSASKTVTVYFVRHGLTDTNQSGILYGQSNVPELTQEGIDASLNVGKNLSDVKFDAVYSSPLSRAYDTASYILKGQGRTDLTIQKKTDLQDISWGKAEGLTDSQVLEKYGVSGVADCMGDGSDPSFVSPIEAETMYDYNQRFAKQMEDILDESKDGDTILVVSHSAMAFYFNQLAGETMGNINNDGVTIVKYFKRGSDTTADFLEYNNLDYAK